MLALKIFGIVLAVAVFLFLLFIWLITRRIRLDVGFDTEKGLSCFVRFLFLKFDLMKPKKKKENKKPSKLVSKLKKTFGLDILSENEELKDSSEGKVSDTATKIITIISLFAGEIGWIIKKCKLHKLNVVAVCAGDDAADAAIEYGLVCAAVYPMSAYLDTNLKTAKNAQKIQIGCDFNGNAYFELGLTLSLRINQVLTALYRSASVLAETQEAKNEQRT